MKAIVVERFGGPEVLVPREVELPRPGAGEARVRVEAAGINFIDVYHRRGLYPLPLPFTPGSEAAGIVDAIGPGVDDVSIGDRVAYAVTPSASSPLRGAYAEYAVVRADRLVKLPAEIDARTAAASMLQGMTAHYLCHSTYPVGPGDVALVHAAAGGVGLLLVQVLKRRGGRVIGTASTPEKAELAREAGADEVILYTERSFVEEARRLTEGRGVQVVYDSVGRDTFDGSLASLAPRGTLVLFGQSSGPVEALDPQRLARQGSVFLTRPVLGHYTATREELLQRAGELLGWIANGELKVRLHRTFPLPEAAEAHRTLESRASTGKLLLLP